MSETDVFRPNGLLGGPSLLQSISQDSSSERGTEPASLFKPNGLLGGTSLLGRSASATDSVSSDFVPNGLLGTSVRPSTPPSSTEAGPSRIQSQTTNENGTAITSLSQSNGPTIGEADISINLSQSQDDELPDISEILRPYPRTTTAASSGDGAFVGAPILLPRSSVRSSTYDGRTVFLKRKPKKLNVPSTSSSSKQSMGNLLGVPLHRLMDELSITAARKISAEDTVSTGADASVVDTDNTLWIDRYRPKRFVDLLGDERLHREVAAWVKEWDYCVFGKRKGKKRAREGEDKFAPEDEYQRPQEKILLMSGPPGLGKTTLAHIVAKHAGYDVFEINASDARSGQIVEDRIRPALESGYAVGSSRPNLIVLDEIDGATGGSDNSSGFIQKLVQLTYERPQKDKRKKKDNKGKRPLLRPIICICNDLYASSLAKLRPVARIVRFTRPADIHIVKRLRDICEYEGLKAEPRALSTLVGIALGDLRGCLNTLQFIKSRNQQVTETLIRAATSGMKEADTSFLTVLNNLFSPMTKKRVKELGLGEEDEARYVDRLSRELDGSGMLDRIATGCFEHYAHTHQHDATFARYLKANEWLVAYDVLSGAMRAEREYALLPYLSYMLVPFYPLFQERGGARVERPKADWEAYTQMRTNEEVYKSLARGVRTGNGRTTGHYRGLVSEPVLHLEFAPFLNRIISPPLRPVNSQVIRPEEKALLKRLVDIMVSLELRFVQEKAEDGQLVYRLDPPIDIFVTYDGKRASDIAVSRYASTPHTLIRTPPTLIYLVSALSSTPVLARPHALPPPPPPPLPPPLPPPASASRHPAGAHACARGRGYSGAHVSPPPIVAMMCAGTDPWRRARTGPMGSRTRTAIRTERGEGGADAGAPAQAREADGAGAGAGAAVVDIADKVRGSFQLTPLAPAVDFFGRPIVVPANGAGASSKSRIKSKGHGKGGKPLSAAGKKQREAEEAAMEMERTYKVSYRFNEGNSAAVRKPVKVASFL
ncbi:hypothetical protein EVG20_g1639 [Dentipellis fragilis]|uniref:AAA+ ATPase domain-containing protein n=1 Tax=Dentipellis fragilis TaxID=205917 RepID=A0A4Y9Z9B8_9AGAM|nr:hypothetical protein EVG20_g1639 [Dentipellis fragilis]